MIRRHFTAGIAALVIGAANLASAPAQANDDVTNILSGVASLTIQDIIDAKSHRSHDRHYHDERDHSDHYDRYVRHRYFGYGHNRGFGRNSYRPQGYSNGYGYGYGYGKPRGYGYKSHHKPHYHKHKHKHYHRHGGHRLKIYRY